MKGLTRETKKIITEAIYKLPPEKKTNCYCICEEVSNILVERYVHQYDEFDEDIISLGKLEYQTKRMGLSTTSEIIDKIELYMLDLFEREKRAKRKELRNIIKEKQQELYNLSF